MKLLYIAMILIFPLLSLGQVLKGTVRDTKNQPMPGISIKIKGTTIGTITDEIGNFQLRIPGPESVIVLSGTNVIKQEIIYSGQNLLIIIMQEKSNSLDEVQIIAYGTNTQRNTVGSITKVLGSDISSQPVTNPLAGLEGRVPGLEVTSTSGVPGASFNVQIRGQNTVNPNLSANSSIPLDQPLFIVDGVPFAPQNSNLNQFPSLAAPGLGYNNPYGGISPLNSLNPADIESIEVLRDADATAIYGSRGGNGVILITTKKGKAGKSEIKLSLNDGESVIGHTIAIMNTGQYLAMRHQAFVNDGLIPNNIPGDPAYAPDLTVFDTTRNTDWKKYFFGNTAHNVNLNASLSGGTANTQFRIGTGFNRDTYIFPGDFADNRATFSTSIHHLSDNKRFTLDFTANYSYDNNNSAGNPAIMTAYSLEPDLPALVDHKGNLIWSYNGVQLDGSNAGSNPLAYLKELYSIQNISLNSNLQFAYKIIDGLTFRTSLGYSTYTSQEYYGDPLAAQNPEYGPQSSARFGNNNFMTWIIEPQLEYMKTIKKAQFNLLAGGTLEKKTNEVSELDGNNYSNDELIHSIAGSATQNATDSYTEYRYVAFFARINVKWDKKYLVDLTGNRDGSSRFGPNKEFGNFGSIGAGWLFNEESFIKNNFGFLSYGKLRGSYGIIGNDNAADYEFLSRWAPSPYSYNGAPGYAAQNLYNPNFSWATTKKLEFGLELGILQDRLLFSSTWYRSRTGNQLITYNLPSQTGFTSVLENEAALVQNTGIELSLTGSIIKGVHFSWNSSINFTFPQNKLLAFPALVESSYSTTYEIGKPLSEIYGFRYAGVNTADGYFQFYTANGQISENPVQKAGGSYHDFVPVGNTDPKYYGGWHNSLIYGQFQLEIFLSFKKQLGMNYLGQVYGYVPGTEINEPVALLNSWKTPGQHTNYEKLSTQDGQSYTGAYDFTESSGAYSDASYIRFKTISFSYSLTGSIVKKLALQNLRLYVAAQNLFTITAYKGNDPETQNFYGVPPLKTISCGLQIIL